jgi:hypothetical protein
MFKLESNTKTIELSNNYVGNKSYPAYICSNCVETRPAEVKVKEAEASTRLNKRGKK